MSVKSKHSLSRKEKLGKRSKKKKLEDSDEDIESSEEELDLTKECHPIGYYMNDRAEMINQMFSVIRGNKLKAMLPPILKDYDLEQLKLQCLDQLLGMSEKRINCILEGETLETSSESEVDESDECDSDERNGTTSGSSSERSDNSHGGHDNDVDGKAKKRKITNENKGGKLPKTDSDTPEQGKTLLEILELEMRARAIRALLKQSGNEKFGDPAAEEMKSGDDRNVNGVKEVTGDVVDLTECEDEEFPSCVKKETFEESVVEKKESKFEEKIEKSKSEKTNILQEDEKSRRVQAELELRNKLFKKKIYRTRQQRMESEEDDKGTEKCDENKIEEKVVIKQEPIEPEEVFVEDPEEGEISTSEDEYPVEVKQEVPELTTPEALELQPPEEPVLEEFTQKIDEDGERVTAIDNGTFINNSNMENITTVSLDKAEEVEPEKEVDAEDKMDKETSIEETSWRDRWLKKDGVQKLVKSSKIYAKVKKRIAEKCLRSKEDVPIQCETNFDSNSNSKMEVIEGSIEEYERLLGKSRDNEGSENGNSQRLNVTANVLPENEMKGNREPNE